MGKEKKKKANDTAPGPLSKALPTQQNSSVPPAGRQLGLCHMHSRDFENKKNNLKKTLICCRVIHIKGL